MTLDASGNLMVGGTSDSYITSSRKVLGITGTSEALISFRASGTAMGYIFAYASAIDISAIGRDFTVSAGTSSPTERFRIAASTGAATFSSSVTATSGLTVGSLGSGSDAIISLATNASGSPRTIYYKASTAAINFTGTGGTDLMTLTNGGNLGIGTTSPSEKLDVIGGAVAAGNGTIRTGITYSSLGLIGTFTNHDLGVITNGSERMRITSGGNVGIGTTSPSWLLQLEKNSTSGGAGQYPALVVNNPNAAGFSAMYFFNGGTNVGGLEYSNSTTNLLLNSYGALLFQTASGNERMRIKSSGVINISNIPTSSSGLSSGDIWNDSGTLKIV
jgi:hypothetical protein